MNIEMARKILKSPLPKKGLFGVTLARTYLEGFEEGVRESASQKEVIEKLVEVLGMSMKFYASEGRTGIGWYQEAQKVIDDSRKMLA